MSDSRYVVGIDLGTTNSALSYVDSRADGAEATKVQVMPIPQLIAPSVVEPKSTLPSFVYQAAGPEFPAGRAGPSMGRWARPCRGLARARAGWKRAHSHGLLGQVLAVPPGRRPHRADPPWGAPEEEVAKLSPLDASVRHLEHLRDAWNHVVAAGDPDKTLEQQEVFLTVPASFDAIARELTMTAARRAGLQTVTLIEEPQAAFYAWLAHQGDDWRKVLSVGDMVLVCDVGGGTTDYTLIEVKNQDGDLILERVAVGDHILLGGDNMDLALALAVSERLGNKGSRLDAWQTRSLWYSCRRAKEQLLSHPEEQSAPVNILGRGSKVIGGSIKADLLRDDLERTLIEGFFPFCEPDRPARLRQARRFAGTRPALRQRRRDHPPPGQVPRAARPRWPRRPPHGHPVQWRRDECGGRCANVSPKSSTAGCRLPTSSLWRSCRARVWISP